MTKVLTLFFPVMVPKMDGFLRNSPVFNEDAFSFLKGSRIAVNNQLVFRYTKCTHEHSKSA